MRAVLYGDVVISRLELLRGHLRTPWELVGVGSGADAGEVRRRLGEADAFVGNVFAPSFAPPPGRLRLIQCVGAGVDAIDTAAIPAGCTLCNVHEHEIPIAEHIMLVVLLFATRLDRIQQAFRDGRWVGSGRFDGEFHDEVCGRTLGLLGCGHIGRAVAARARAFGMNVIAISRRPCAVPGLAWYGTMAELPRLLRESDFLTVTCPLTAETRGLIGERELRLLRSTAFLINVARAEIVREGPLYQALTQRWFAGAALDVWYRYPDSPAAGGHGSQLPFHTLDNVIATPHSSAWTRQLIDRRYRRIAENLDRLARGEALQKVVAPVEP
jgi:phosphoglycerate dehydrogenase-like enzyme